MRKYCHQCKEPGICAHIENEMLREDWKRMHEYIDMMAMPHMPLMEILQRYHKEEKLNSSFREVAIARETLGSLNFEKEKRNEKYSSRIIPVDTGSGSKK